MIRVRRFFYKRLAANCLLLLIILSFGKHGIAQKQTDIFGTAQVNGTKLSYELRGQGEAVVFVHGGLADSRLWDDQIKKFAEHYLVLRYDLRGFGKSEFPTTPYSHIEDLYALLKFLKISKVTIVGLSLGGIVAVDFTLEHPEMVKGLVLVSSGLRGHPQAKNSQSVEVAKIAEEQGMEKAIQKWLEHPFFASGKSKKRFEQRMKTMLTDNYRYWGPTPLTIIVNYPSPPSIERLSAIKVPTLIIVGGKDASNIQAIGETLTTKIINVQKIVIPDVGHHPNMEKPKEFNKILLTFLEEF
jgi:pimeloyl-ACP methyl ester carboxylesterase